VNDDHKLAEWLREVDEQSYRDADEIFPDDDAWERWHDAARLSFARAIARECVRICEERADYYQQKDRFKFPELCDSAPTGAESCADAIRQRFGIEKEAK